MDTPIDFKGIVENGPFVSMRLSYENGLWKTWYISDNISIFGYNPADFLAQKLTWVDLLHPDDRIVTQTLARDYIKKNVDNFRLEYRIVTSKGESIYITEFSHINRNPDGSVACVDSTLINTTTVQGDKNAAANHFRQQAIITDILLSMQDSDLDSALQIILAKTGDYLNTSRALLFKDSPDHKTCKVVKEWLNRDITSVMDLDYSVTYSTEMPEIYVALQDTGVLLVNAGEIPENCREEFEKEGLVSSAIFAVYLHGEHYGFVCFDDCVVHRTWDMDTANFLKNIANLLSNVLMRKHTEETLRVREVEVQQMAYTDSLTGLPNRFRLHDDLEVALKASGASGRSFHAAFIDLDDFKVVNDSYGHDFGDGVLKSFAAFAADLFKNAGRVYRFGGDEFVIIIDSGEEARMLAFLDAMIERAKSPWHSLGKDFFCSLSIGVVKCRAPDDDTQSVIKKADMAMYSAKTSGKNNYAFYTETMGSESLNRSEMEALIRQAIQNDFAGFNVHYQPYTELSSQRIIGAEALLRMAGPNDTYLLPDQFLPLAEYLGLMVPLGEHVLRQAAMQCGTINRINGFADFTVTVNMSARQFKQKNLVQRSMEIIREAGVNPGNIITASNERHVLDDMDALTRLCREFKRMGVGTALDDFGSGSASFTNLRDLPVDIIKVSGKYMREIDDKFTRSYLNFVTEMGHLAGKKICMNGVERESEYDFCIKAGADMVQGFLLYKPGDAKALFETIATKMTGVFYPGGRMRPVARA